MGFCIFATQSILYLGWHDFLMDIDLTFGARNYAEKSQSLANLRKFYDSRNVLFFYNLQSTVGIIESIRLFFGNVFAVATPLLTFLSTTLAAAAILGDPRAAVFRTSFRSPKSDFSFLTGGLIFFFVSLLAGDQIFGSSGNLVSKLAGCSSSPVGDDHQASVPFPTLGLFGRSRLSCCCAAGWPLAWLRCFSGWHSRCRRSGDRPTASG